MARDPALVAREEAARVRGRVEAALAKAIAESTRPLISQVDHPVAAGEGSTARNEQQLQPQEALDTPREQQADGTAVTPGAAKAKVSSLEAYLARARAKGPNEPTLQPGALDPTLQSGAREPTLRPGAPEPTHQSALGVREQQQQQQLLQQQHRQQHREQHQGLAGATPSEPTLQPGPAPALEQQQQHQQQQQQEQRQGQASVTHNPGSALTLEQQQQQLQHQGHPLWESDTARALRRVGEKRQLVLQQQQHQRQQHLEQQQQQQLGKTTTGITINLNPNQDSSLLGLFATTAVRARVSHIKAIVSPPHGTNMATLQSGLPPANHDLSTSDSDSSEASEASQLMANNSTGSGKVDNVKINLDMSEGETNELLNPEEEDNDEMAVEDS
jgi:hypothetical protein